MTTPHTPPTFEHWLFEVELCAAEIGMAGYIIKLDTNKPDDSWRSYFDDGCTPEDALREDLTYA